LSYELAIKVTDVGLIFIRGFGNILLCKFEKEKSTSRVNTRFIAATALQRQAKYRAFGRGGRDLFIKSLGI
jgi:hypothetical protein